MTEKKAKILLVEDNANGRREITTLISDDLGYQVRSPNSIRELREAFTFELFDSLLIDLDLSDFDDIGDQLDGKTIDNGQDVLEFYRALHQTGSAGLYTSHQIVPGSPFELRTSQVQNGFSALLLPKPLPRNMQQIGKVFEPVFEEAEAVCRSNPLLRSFSYYGQKDGAKSLRAYNRVCVFHQNWFNFSLRNVGNLGWGVVCGRATNKDFFGQPLNGQEGDGFLVQSRDDYPSIDELRALAMESDLFAFVIWNMESEFIAKQFELAGSHLEKIPDHLQHYFSIAMAGPCVRTYEEGEEDLALARTSKLTLPAQVEVMKRLFKLHRGNDSLDFFRQKSENFKLPVIIEIYDCRVDAIDRPKQTAWVELRKLDSSRAVSMEPFDLRQMLEYGIDHDHQRFEYTVYRVAFDHVGMSITPIEFPKLESA